MKKLFFILSFLILVNSPLMATVLRVNNQLPTNAALKIFATIQLAHDNASPGDTLMVEGSPTRYPGADISKKLTIIGTGYFINENFENSGSLLLSRVSNIEFIVGSDGSVVIGLFFSDSYNPILRSSNILISRCLFSDEINFGFATISGVVITQNYFQTGALAGIGAVNNIVFSNNIVSGTFNPGSTESVNFSSVNNNIFRGTGTNAINVQTENFRNNIIATNATSIKVLSNNISNNLISLANQLTGNGNQVYDPTQLFVGATGNSTDGQFRLKENSPYKTAGFQGVEPGIFGGTWPYVLSGMPPFPIILNLSADSFGTQQNGLNVSIKAKTNN